MGFQQGECPASNDGPPSAEAPQPGRDLREIEERVMPPPQQQGRRSVRGQVGRDRVEPPPRGRHSPRSGARWVSIRPGRPMARQSSAQVRGSMRAATSAGRPPTYCSRTPSAVRWAVAAAVFLASGADPEFPRVGPLRTKARAMGVGVLDDESTDPARRAHGQVQADGRAVVVEVDEALLDAQPLEQFLDAVGERRERRPVQNIRGAEPGQVGRHDTRPAATAARSSRGKVREELGNPCSSTSAGRVLSPAVLKARSPPRARRVVWRTGSPGGSDVMGGRTQPAAIGFSAAPAFEGGRSIAARAPPASRSPPRPSRRPSRPARRWSSGRRGTPG